jgi:DNA replication and repair protein RecF
VRDFRNLVRVTMELPATGIALIGDNGQGKTNLLEAVAYLHLLRSVRGAPDVEVARFGSAGFHVRGVADVDGRRREAAVGFERATRRKKVVIDGGEAERLSDGLGAVPSVTFSPVDVELVRGGPGVRRRYLDVVLATTSRQYLAALQAYRGALDRRNAALRSGAREAAVSAWEPLMADAGAVVWAQRVAWVERWAGELGRVCGAAGEPGTVGVRYVARAAAEERRESATSVEGADREVGDEPATIATLRTILERAFAAGRPGDSRRGMTRAGPHRDDICLTLDARLLQTYGSAGQQRTVAIALRLLEAETLRVHAGGSPVLLFDDPFAELDESRSRAVLDVLYRGGLVGGGGRGSGECGAQVVLAVPRMADIPSPLTTLEHWRISAGVVARAA